MIHEGEPVGGLSYHEVRVCFDLAITCLEGVCGLTINAWHEDFYREFRAGMSAIKRWRELDEDVYQIEITQLATGFNQTSFLRPYSVDGHIRELQAANLLWGAMRAALTGIFTLGIKTITVGERTNAMYDALRTLLDKIYTVIRLRWNGLPESQSARSRLDSWVRALNQEAIYEIMAGTHLVEVWLDLREQEGDTEVIAAARAPDRKVQIGTVLDRRGLADPSRLQQAITENWS